MDLIADGIYLSSCHEAEDFGLLEAQSIKSIVSIGHGFTAQFADKGIKYHLIPIEDDANENALDHFDDAVAFITESVAANEKVLVHCMAGVSRSPTFVAAYLMNSKGLTAPDAVDLIRAARESVSPNEGFLTQLDIYQRMGNKVNQDSADYRRFLLSQAAYEQQQLGTLTKLKMTADPSKQALPQKTRYLRCKMCRRQLLAQDSIIPHEIGAGQSVFQYRKRDNAIQMISQTVNTAVGSKCSSYCTEPMEWMTEVGDGYLEGKIVCPNEKCGAKLGAFSWSGIACPCGTWVAPAFTINKQKVDVVGLL